mgnify:CR=1 FL=1
MNNNETPLVSLIIPVYNVEGYLRKALESVEKQTFKNFETIIVNDGSTDASLNIINEFVEKNPNFHVISQKNSGLSAARNTGLNASRGEYIAFMDSDDYINPDFISVLYEACVKNNADIACCNFNLYYPSRNLRVYMPFTCMPGIYSKSKALKKLILDLGLHYFSWNKLCKRSLFFENNIKFYDMYFEDIATSPRLFYHANKVVVSGKALYNYTNRETSILNTINVAKVNDFIRSLGVMRNFFEKQNDYKKYKNRIWLYSQKVKLISYYYTLQLHMEAMNFKGFMDNILSATKSIDYFTSDKYKSLDSDVPELPYFIKKPPKRIKVKKKKSERM